MTAAKPPSRPVQTADIVARTPRDLKTMSDTDLLGEDYKGWLGEEKSEVNRVLRDGEDARARAERLMARSEALIRKASDQS